MRELAEDWDGPWLLSREVKRILGTEDPVAVREATLRLVRDMLEGELVRPGALSESGFEPWEERGTAALRRIEAAWSETNRLPRAGEMVWFEITPKGERLVS